MAEIPFIKARNFTRTGGVRVIDLIVVHDMESNEEPDTAEKVAAWFGGPTAPQASAHYCIDSNSVVQCVKDNDVAWHAPGANHNGIGLEHAGRARQTEQEWADPYSEAMLGISAALTASLLTAHKLPAEFVSKAGLLAGQRGITTHNEVSLAFKKSTHTDPGAHFPMAHFLELVRASLPEAHMPEPQDIVTNAPPLVTLMHATWPEGSYLVVCTDGGTFPFGGAPQIGSLGGTPLNKPIVDATLTPSGKGLKMLGADGGDFNFGDAQFKGKITYNG